MALFKICRGNESNLPTTLTDGYAYFCTDTGNFYIDWADSDGNVSREHISAEYATKLRYKDDNGEWVEIDPKDLIENQVQADWSETDTTSKSYIKNKPFDDTIPNSYFDFMEEISNENSGATTYKIKSDYLPAFDTESVSITVTLSANMWASSQQVLSVNGVTAESNGFVGVAQNITDAQMVAAKLAELHVCGQGDGTITVAAFGDTPNCDIPITIILV